MKDNRKDLENTNLTDEQTEQVSGGSAPIHIKREKASDHEQNNRKPNEVKYKPEPWYH